MNVFEAHLRYQVEQRLHNHHTRPREAERHRRSRHQQVLAVATSRLIHLVKRLFKEQNSSTVLNHRPC